MASERMTQDEHIALLQNGENSSQEFDEEYILHSAGTSLLAVLCTLYVLLPLVDHLHPAQHPNDRVQHGTSLKATRPP